MKIYSYLLIIISTLLCFSCSDQEAEITDEVIIDFEDFTDEEPVVPEDLQIDLDDDGTAEYVIHFEYVEIDPGNDPNVGFFGIKGSIDPIDNHQVLTQRQEGNLFLRNLENIKNTVEEPLRWNTSGLSRQIMILYANKDGLWPIKWKLNTDESHSTYFLGLKLINDNSTQIGWVELDINRSNGIVEIIDKGTL